MDNIKALTQKYYPEIIKLRRYFHKHPEVSKKEFNTQKKIIDILSTMDLDIRIAGKTGIIADLRGKNPGNTIAIRADIDALAIDEERDSPYKSENKGACHACGHDGHTAILIGVIKILSELRSQINGTIRFIFQPSEEEVADGSGAHAIIEDGGLKDVDAIIGLHLWQSLPIGTAGISSGINCISNSSCIKHNCRKRYRSNETSRSISWNVSIRRSLQFNSRQSSA
ncbi:amidohydrolase [Clostridium sp. cel8]|uniref:M20 metallopeptidase family protein n=1 Tax=Clostridium sp. cel8 TaxID=2663123 RepID=UPI001FADC2BB|nr:amidohydrolase [Clostridium sp. cel8]